MNLQSYFNLIVTERHWSWTLIGIIYLGVTLSFRQLLFRKIVRETKELDANLYSSVRKVYLRNSVAGWVLFLIPFLFVVVGWILKGTALFEGKIFARGGMLLCLLFLLSVIFHFIAFAKALLTVLRHRMGLEKEF